MFLSQSARDVLQARAQWHVSAGSEQICQRTTGLCCVSHQDKHIDIIRLAYRTLA
jgi:hypothetical protein